MTAGLTGEEFDQCFRWFASSPSSTRVFRWEGLQHYAIAADEPSLVAFREALPRPERSVRTSPWLARIATSTAAGKDWSRARYIAEPLTEYVRWELLAYVESQAVGERILVIPGGSQFSYPDFWVFDGAVAADRYAIVMHYDRAGSPVEFEYTNAEPRVTELLLVADELCRDSIPLNSYLAPRRKVSGAA